MSWRPWQMHGSLIEQDVLPRRTQPTFSKRLLNLSNLERNGGLKVVLLLTLKALCQSAEMAGLVGVGSVEIAMHTRDAGNAIASVAVLVFCILDALHSWLIR
mmetsp:Transcript_3848/g.8669  ORF Transcript_3848/g.8669 Transcript_3848/m.8669 type:complete len:102 (-) Transcript_3848:933-1238(-)